MQIIGVHLSLVEAVHRRTYAVGLGLYLFRTTALEQESEGILTGSGHKLLAGKLRRKLSVYILQRILAGGRTQIVIYVGKIAYLHGYNGKGTGLR